MKFSYINKDEKNVSGECETFHNINLGHGSLMCAEKTGGFNLVN